MEPDNISDEERLGLNLNKGSALAFEEIYTLYNKQIYHFILGYVHSQDLAEDLTQEVFIKLWENRLKLIHFNAIKFYLYKIAKNHTINSLKKIAHSQHALQEVISSYPENRDTTDDLVQEKEYNKWINDALNDLTPRAREIFSLCREQGKSYNEAAKELGISRNAIKHQMVHVLKILRKITENQLEIPMSILIVISLLN